MCASNVFPVHLKAMQFKSTTWIWIESTNNFRGNLISFLVFFFSYFVVEEKFLVLVTTVKAKVWIQFNSYFFNEQCFLKGFVGYQLNQNAKCISNNNKNSEFLCLTCVCMNGKIEIVIRKERVQYP